MLPLVTAVPLTVPNPLAPVFRRLFKDSDSSHARIVRGLFTVGIFVLGGKIAAALREMAIAWRYGVGEVVDAYVFAYVLITWIPGVWVAILTAIYVPLILSLSDHEQRRFKAQLHAWTLSGSLLLMLAIYLLLPAVLPLVSANMAVTAQELLRETCQTLAPLAGLGMVIGLYAAMLLAEERHANTLLEAVPALVVLAAVLVFATATDTRTLVWSTLVGTALQALLLYALLRRSRTAPGVHPSISSPSWSGFRQALGALALSQLIISLSLPIDQFLASQLDTGSLSTLGYANRVLALALGLGATAIGRAILPVLSNQALASRERRSLARHWFRIMLLVSLLGVLLGYFLSPALVHLLFERGAFTAENSAAVSAAVRIGLWQLPAVFAGTVAVQLFASLRSYRPIVISGCVVVGVKLLAGPWLASQMGVRGILLSTALMYTASGFYLYWQLQREPVDS